MTKKIKTIGIIFMVITSLVIFFENVSAEDPPQISLVYDYANNELTIASVNNLFPLYYNDNSSYNLVFVKNNDTYYVEGNLTITTTRTPTYKEIGAGDTITGFTSGTYTAKWLPTNTVYLTFTIEDDYPLLSATYDHYNKEVTITTTESDYYYNNPISGHNIVFIKNNQKTYYVDNNLTITTTRTPTYKEIEAGDTITGFTTGSYVMKWLPTNTVYLTFTVSGEEDEDYQTPYIKIISPNGGETWESGTLNKIIWEYSWGSGPHIASITYVSIDLYMGNLFYEHIDNSIVEARSYSWLIPENHTQSDDFKIRITWEQSYYDFSDKYFKIENKPQSFGLISGEVLGLENINNMSITYPLKDASTCAIKTSEENECVFTNQNGQYEIWVTPGTYTITSSKKGYKSEKVTNVAVSANENIEVNFELEKDIINPPQPSQGLIAGIVLSQTENNSNIIIDNASICAIKTLKENESTTSKCTFTNQNGQYEITVKPGTYTITASKKGYKSEKVTNVTVSANENIEVNFELEKGPTEIDFIIVEKNRLKIEEAIRKQNVGGEISIQKRGDETFKHNILLYDSINITQIGSDEDAISFIVSGDENSTGKTIAMNVDFALFKVGDEVIVEYDGEKIKMADDIDDILNPNNDGSHAEYLVTWGAEGVQILISIPHFSEHSINVYALEEFVESVGGINVLITYIALCLVATFLFIGIVHLRRRI